MRNEKVCNLALIYGRIAKIRVGEHDGDVGFLTGNRNMSLSRRRNEKICNLALIYGRIAKFLNLIGNRGRGTRG